MNRELLVASTFKEDVIMIVEINTDLLDFLEKCDVAYRAVCESGLKSAMLKIPIPKSIICDFYEIKEQHKKKFETGVLDIKVGSLEYYALPEIQRDELMKQDVSTQWNTFAASYSNHHINEDTIPFSRFFSDNDFLWYEKGCINIESSLHNKMSETINVQNLKVKLG